MNLLHCFPLPAARALALALLLSSASSDATEVLFIGGGSAATSGADAAAYSYLEGRYGASHVEYLSATESVAGDEAGYDVLVISSTPSSSDLRGKFHNSTVPVVNWEEALADNAPAGEFGVTTDRRFDNGSDHTIYIIDAAHPITAGFAFAQAVQITSGSSTVWWSGGLQADGADSLAMEWDSDGFITIVEQGGILLNGSPAPARRVMFGMTDNTFNKLTAAGRQLFGQAVDWAAGGADVGSPTVTHSTATGISATDATLAGEVTDTGGATPEITIYWGDDDGGMDPGTWDHSISLGVQSGTFSTGLGGLAPATPYYFRCFAANAAGSDWADATASFETAAASNPPTLVNAPATTIDFTTADVNGVVTGTGGEDPEVTIYYGQGDGGTVPEDWDFSVNLGPRAAGSFSRGLLYLTDNTTYHFRAFAQNSGGGAWAPSTASFTTSGYSLPSVVNDSAATGITSLAAQVGGEVTETGGDAPQVTIYYGRSDGGEVPANWDLSVGLGIRGATFSTILTGLDPLATYYFRSVAQNAAGTVWATTSGSFTTLDLSELVINEFMAANDGGDTNNPNAWYPIANQIPGTSDDWIEIRNTGATTLDLAGWHLTDNASEPGKWTFPPGTHLAGGGFLIVYASKDDAPDANGNLHTNFKLSASGEYLALVRPGGTIASEFGPAGSDYPRQEDDISYGLHPATAASVHFSSPTPGAANDAGGIARVADTKFSPDRGYYQSAVGVTITCDTPDAAIYYTTDGMPPIDGNGAPSAGASVYSGPVALTRTTPVRAVAVKPGHDPTDIDTHTYILLDIDGANADGTDAAGLNTPFIQQTQPTGWADFPVVSNDPDGDYDMDTAISQSTAIATGLGVSTARAMLRGMRDIPTISIAMDRTDFMGPNGIYTNSDKKGFDWERVCSAEFLPASEDLRDDWQQNCGLRVQGGNSRFFTNSPKHAFSFRFRSEYGAGKLRQPLFPGSEVEEFDVLSLRAGYNNSWIHRASAQRTAASMIRDQWMRQSMLDMGNPAAGEGFMVHLFINGLYWGVQNLCERQDASHYAAHNDADKDTIDARNAGKYVNGNSTAWNEIDDVVDSGDWEKIQQVIDIDQYIDYHIINRYGGNLDVTTGGNWRASGGGPFPAGEPEQMAPWQLYSWDAERVLERVSETRKPFDPMGVRGTLEGDAEYRMRFADRLQKHFFNGGSLTPTACSARWSDYAVPLDRAIIAESARWGDHRQSPAHTRDAEWLTEQNRLYNTYFPVRSTNVLNGYDNLFPDTEAPGFLVNGTPQHGGVIPSDDTLTLTAASGAIYYTTDGSDPRLAGGGVSGSAIMIASGSGVTLAASGQLRVRALDGGEWSALDEATFYIEPLAGPGDLAIAEIHYHPHRAGALEKAAGAALPVPRPLDNPDDFEFIEIRNISSGALNLDGVAFTGGIGFTFGNTVLAAGAHAVVVRDAEAFAIRYPGVPIAGTFAGALDNNGERIALATSGGSPVLDFTYSDSGQWPGRPDGNGSSLELADAAGDYGTPETWRASCEFHGSPGAPGNGPDGRIVVNEVLTHTDAPSKDTIELHNTTGTAIDIGGWHLTDDNGVYPSFAIPATTIPGGGYVTFDEDDFNGPPTRAITAYSGTPAATPATVTSAGHGLATGDVITIAGYGGLSAFNDTFEVTVTSADQFTIDTPFLDNHATTGQWIAGRPFALSAVRGDDLWLLETGPAGQALKFVDHVDFAAAFWGESLGRWPDGAGTGTLVSMTSHTPASVNLGAQVGPVIISEVIYHPDASAEDALEFVEIHNAGQTSENLANWRLRGGADFNFTAAHSLAPGEALVVVAFDPLGAPGTAAAFRSAYGIDATIPLAGPFTDGPLGNDTGTVRLQRPDTPPATDPSYYPQVTEDEVIYRNLAPWPVGAAGNGGSLERLAPELFGNFASSWVSDSPSPGGKRIEYAEWRDLVFGPGSPAGSDPLEDHDRDGILNIMEYALGLTPLAGDAGSMPVLAFEDGEVSMTYTRDLLQSDITLRVEMSGDLVNWTTVPEEVVSSVNFIETRKASVSMTSFPKLFLRIAVDH